MDLPKGLFLEIGKHLFHEVEIDYYDNDNGARSLCVECRDCGVTIVKWRCRSARKA
jgi:hypothetical protein